MLTLALLLLPLIGSLVVLAVKGEAAKKTALAFSLLTLAATVFLWTQYQPEPGYKFTLDQLWLQDPHITFSIGIDGLGMLMVILTNFLMPFIIMSTFDRVYDRPSGLMSLMLLMQSALVGVFVARDAFLFYIFWELALIPIYFISLIWGGENRSKITFKFFIYTLFGSLLMLFAFIFIYFNTPGKSFSMEAFYNANISTADQSWVFWFLFLAFAIKMPVFPFHTWQPSTYRVNSTPGTMLLSGIMLKMGIFGVLKWLIPVVPAGAAEWANVAMILSVTGIVYASSIAIIQTDFKKLLAYSSIAHVGLISAGIFAGTEDGLRGGMIQMLMHGINVVGLFFIADILWTRRATFNMSEFGGLRTLAPLFATGFLIILLGSVALPLTNGFVGEFMLLAGVFNYNPFIAAIAGLTIILGAVYMLLSYKNIMHGEPLAQAPFADLTFNEKAILIPLSLAVIVTGVYPKPLLMLVEPAVQDLLTTLK